MQAPVSAPAFHYPGHECGLLPFTDDVVVAVRSIARGPAATVQLRSSQLGTWRCSVCRRTAPSDPYFHCAEPGPGHAFDVCMRCASASAAAKATETAGAGAGAVLPPGSTVGGSAVAVRHPSHSCALALLTDSAMVALRALQAGKPVQLSSRGYTNWRCNVCRRNAPSDPYYHCPTHNYDVCLGCAPAAGAAEGAAVEAAVKAVLATVAPVATAATAGGATAAAVRHSMHACALTPFTDNVELAVTSMEGGRPTTLQLRERASHRAWTCHVCRRKAPSDPYLHCLEHDYNVCMACASAEAWATAKAASATADAAAAPAAPAIAIVHPSHACGLTMLTEHAGLALRAMQGGKLVQLNSRGYTSWRCNVCRSTAPSDPYFHCPAHNYDVCLGCAPAAGKAAADAAVAAGYAFERAAKAAVVASAPASAAAAAAGGAGSAALARGAVVSTPSFRHPAHECGLAPYTDDVAAAVRSMAAGRGTVLRLRLQHEQRDWKCNVCRATAPSDPYFHCPEPDHGFNVCMGCASVSGAAAAGAASAASAFTRANCP